MAGWRVVYLDCFSIVPLFNHFFYSIPCMHAFILFVIHLLFNFSLCVRLMIIPLRSPWMQQGREERSHTKCIPK